MIRRMTMLAATAAAMFVMPSTGVGQDYEHAFQHRVGHAATFNMVGPATAGDPEGDALLKEVVMPDGEKFDEFYRPIAIHQFSFTGDGTKMTAFGGANCTIGRNSATDLGAAIDDGDTGTISASDLTAFPAHVLDVLKNKNLNNYLDTSTNDGWSFIMEFDLTLKDNDDGADDTGELLYFERGAGGGNSWIIFQAVDKHGNALGPALAINPDETADTSPVTTLKDGQTMGAVAIDLSRLGVNETKYLRVMRPTAGVGGYTSGEYKADFKVMAVITDPHQITLKKALYD